MLKYLSRMRLKKMQNGGRPQGDPPSFDVNSLIAGIMRVESQDDKFMMNPTSTATGRYGQLFSEIQDLPQLQGMSREQFADDIALQDMVFMMRADGMLPGVPGLIRSARDLSAEYAPQIKGFDFRPDEVAALVNFLGRQGTRKYFASLRDGTSFSPPGVNKTPEQYLEKYNQGVADQMKRKKMNDGGKVGRKIKVLKKEGRPHDQAVAIALSMRDRNEL